MYACRTVQTCFICVIMHTEQWGSWCFVRMTQLQAHCNRHNPSLERRTFSTGFLVDNRLIIFKCVTLSSELQAFRHPNQQDSSASLKSHGLYSQREEDLRMNCMPYSVWCGQQSVTYWWGANCWKLKPRLVLVVDIQIALPPHSMYVSLFLSEKRCFFNNLPVKVQYCPWFYQNDLSHSNLMLSLHCNVWSKPCAAVFHRLSRLCNLPQSALENSMHKGPTSLWGQKVFWQAMRSWSCCKLAAYRMKGVRLPVAVHCRER